MRLEPARYRLVLRHPDGRTEAGAFRRYRADAPRIGHTFSTIVDGVPAAGRLPTSGCSATSRASRTCELTAERDYSEAEDAPDLPEHELEHALAREDCPGRSGRDARAGRGVRASWSSWSRSSRARRPTGTRPSATSTR